MRGTWGTRHPAFSSLLGVLIFSLDIHNPWRIVAASSALFRRLQSIEMSDTLYLSLWYPNLRLEALAGQADGGAGTFAAHGGEARVYAATVWPVNWSESPVFQQVYGRRVQQQGRRTGGELGAEPRSGRRRGAGTAARRLRLRVSDWLEPVGAGDPLGEMQVLRLRYAPLRMTIYRALIRMTMLCDSMPVGCASRGWCG